MVFHYFLYDPMRCDEHKANADFWNWICLKSIIKLALKIHEAFLFKLIQNIKENPRSHIVIGIFIKIGNLLIHSLICNYEFIYFLMLLNMLVSPKEILTINCKMVLKCFLISPSTRDLDCCISLSDSSAVSSAQAITQLRKVTKHHKFNELFI